MTDTIPKRLRAAREAKGMSREELAKAANTLLVAVEMGEGDEFEFPEPWDHLYLMTWRAFANALDTTTGWLVDGDSDE